MMFTLFWYIRREFFHGKNKYIASFLGVAISTALISWTNPDEYLTARGSHASFDIGAFHGDHMAPTMSHFMFLLSGFSTVVAAWILIGFWFSSCDQRSKLSVLEMLGISHFRLWAFVFAPIGVTLILGVLFGALVGATAGAFLDSGLL